MYCLPTYLAERFRSAIVDGTINIRGLIFMSPSQRRQLFANVFKGTGDADITENARKVNALFESKLLLPNQQKGMKDFIDQTTGLRTDVKKDLLTKINNMTEVLNPSTEKTFLADLAAQKLGVTVTVEEARLISKLAKEASTAERIMESSPRREHLGKATDTEMNYGRARIGLADYITELKSAAKKPHILSYVKPTRWYQGFKKLAGIAKSAKATLDNSALFRQGTKPFWANPRLWFRNGIKSFQDIIRTIDGKEVMAEVRADIVSRPNYENYVKDDVALNVTEEEFPETELLRKIPVFGILHKAAEVAFTAFAQRNRADFYDYYAKIKTEQGEDPTGIGIGKLVNNLTGRGTLPFGMKGEAAAFTNVAFFSIRFFMSNVHFMTAHAFDSEMSLFAKKQAAKNLLKMVVGTAGILAMAHAVDPEFVELDPTSANFGKIKIGNTRFDVTGGMGSMITLAARFFTGRVKSSTTGVTKKLNTGEFGSKTRVDLIYDYMGNKFSPAMATVRDIARGYDFDYEKPTTEKVLRNLFVPIIIEEYDELKSDPQSANILLALICEGLGIGINTYSAADDWTQSTGKVLLQFKERVGSERFKKANEDYNAKWLYWLDEVSETKTWEKMSEENKKKAITKKKVEIKNRIFRKYGFKYRG